MFTEPNVLILDEPTNDLDTDMLAAIEDLLDIWPGTLIVVSHDRYLLERVTDNQYGLLGDGKVRHLPGGVDQYLQLKSPKKTAEPKKVQSQELTGGERRNLEKESARLERLIAKLESQLTQVHLELAAADQSDYEVLSGLSAKESAIREEIELSEQSWLEVAQKLQQ